MNPIVALSRCYTFNDQKYIRTYICYGPSQYTVADYVLSCIVHEF